MAASDVFISYSFKDDWPDNWVKSLREELVHRIGSYDATLEPKIWLDKNSIESGQLFDSAIREAVEGARVFLCVVSTNYADSEWALRELRLFWGMPLSKGRVVKVKKLPLPLNFEDALPEPLPGMEEHRFYREPAAASQRPVLLSTLERESVASEVAWQLHLLIRNARANKGTVVLLADPDRLGDRIAVRNEILLSGYEVEPVGLPQDPALRQEAIAECVSRATFSVLLFGKSFSPDLEFALDQLTNTYANAQPSPTAVYRCLSSVPGLPADERRKPLYERLQRPPPSLAYTPEERPTNTIREYLAKLEVHLHKATLFLCSSRDHRDGIDALLKTLTRTPEVDVLDPFSERDSIGVFKKAEKRAHGCLIYADEDQAAFLRLRKHAKETMRTTRSPDLVAVYPSKPSITFEPEDLRGLILIVPPDGAGAARTPGVTMTLDAFLAELKRRATGGAKGGRDGAGPR
jgi:hypothetical protein